MTTAESLFPLSTTIHSLLRLEPTDVTGQSFALTGVVIEKNKSRDGLYVRITDGISIIQIILPRDPLPDFGLTAADISIFDRASVSGLYTLSGKNHTVSLVASAFRLLVKQRDFSFDQFDYDNNVHPMLDLAYITKSLSDLLFAKTGFVEMDCRFISSSHAPIELGPLRVIFEGRGCPVYLEVSPLPQLLFACLMGGISSVFTRSRLFTRAHRDGFTSAESQVLAACQIARDGKLCLPGVLPTTVVFHGVATSLLSWLATYTGSARFEGFELQTIADWPDNRQNEIPLVTAPTIVIRNVADSDTLGRAAYSARQTIELIVPEGFAIVEGHLGSVGATIEYESITVHIERIHRLLRNSDRWRVRRIQSASPLSG